MGDETRQMTDVDPERELATGEEGEPVQPEEGTRPDDAEQGEQAEGEDAPATQS